MKLRVLDSGDLTWLATTSTMDVSFIIIIIIIIIIIFLFPATAVKYWPALFHSPNKDPVSLTRIPQVLRINFQCLTFLSPRHITSYFLTTSGVTASLLYVVRAAYCFPQLVILYKIVCSWIYCCCQVV